MGGHRLGALQRPAIGMPVARKVWLAMGAWIPAAVTWRRRLVAIATWRPAQSRIAAGLAAHNGGDERTGSDRLADVCQRGRDGTAEHRLRLTPKARPGCSLLSQRRRAPSSRLGNRLAGHRAGDGWQNRPHPCRGLVVNAWSCRSPGEVCRHLVRRSVP